MKYLRILTPLFFLYSLVFGDVYWDGNDYALSPSAPWEMLNLYTGNFHHEITDLEMKGTLNASPFSKFKRIGNSRITTGKTYFGEGHEWSHSFDYTLTEAGTDGSGRDLIRFKTPRGEDFLFVEVSPNTWEPESAGIPYLAAYEPTSYIYVIVDNKGNEFTFALYSSGSNSYWWLYGIEDNLGINYTATSDHTLKVVSGVTRSDGQSFTLNYTQVSGKTVLSSVSTGLGESVTYSYGSDTINGVTYNRLTEVQYSTQVKATFSYYYKDAYSEPYLYWLQEPKFKYPNVRLSYNTLSGAPYGAVTSAWVPTSPVTYLAKLGTLVQSSPVVLDVDTGAGSLSRYTFYYGGNLDTWDDTESNFWDYDYDVSGQGFLIERTDPLSRSVSFDPTNLGNSESETYPGQNIFQYVRDAYDRIQSVTNPESHTYSFGRDSSNRITTQTTPSGGTYTVTYNAQSLPTQIVAPNNATTSYTYSGGLTSQETDAYSNVTSYGYNSEGDVISVTDARNNTTNFTWSNTNQLTSITYPDNSVESFSYDTKGNLVSWTNPENETYSYAYDQLRRVTSITDPLGNVHQLEYEKALPKPIKLTYPSGKVVEYTYDGNRKLTSVTLAAGTPDEAIWSYQYNAHSMLERVIDPQGYATVYGYNNLNQLQSVTDPLGYITYYTHDGIGRITSVQDRNGNTTTYSYSANVEPVTGETNAENHSTQYQYDVMGRLTHITDANNNTYIFSYDLLGRMTQLTYPNISSESYAYDAVGNLVQETNRAGDIQTLTYDNRNRLTSKQWDDGSPATQYEYDDAGRITRIYVPGISDLTYTFDAAGRMTSETQNIIGFGSRTVQYGYDSDSRRTSITYPSSLGTYLYSYNDLDMVTSVQKSGETNAIVDYFYDYDGSMIQSVYENGYMTEVYHDASNRETARDFRVSGNPVTSSIDYGYDQEGNRLWEKWENGRGHTFEYDATNQVEAGYYNALTPDGIPWNWSEWESLTYDGVGNRTNRSGTETWAYLHNSNNSMTYVSFPGSGGYQTVGVDANGNMSHLPDFSGGNSWSYSFDANNRLTSVTNGTDSMSIVYDGRNRPIKRTFNGVSYYYVYSDWNLIAEYIPMGYVTQHYVHGRRIDEILLKVNGGTKTYYHYDSLGSVTQLTDVSANVVEQYEYTAFGKVKIRDGSGNLLTSSQRGNRFMFTGRESFLEYGFYDYRNRIYNAELGRFMQTDPIRFRAGDVNIYRYVNNISTGFTDPFGLAVDWYEVGDGVGDLVLGYGEVIAGAHVIGGSVVLTGTGQVGLGFAGVVGGSAAVVDGYNRTHEGINDIISGSSGGGSGGGFWSSVGSFFSGMFGWGGSGSGGG